MIKNIEVKKIMCGKDRRNLFYDQENEKKTKEL